MSLIDGINNANIATKNIIGNIENEINTIPAKANKFLNLGKNKSPLKMLVNNKEFTEFNSLRISYSIDSACSAFSFNTIFYPSKGTSNTIKPFGLEEISIKYNNNDIFNGYIEKITTGYSNDGSNLNVQGRSKGGILVDSDIKKASYNTTTIVNLAQLNGFTFVDVDPNENFISLDIDEGENMFGFLSKLASQKGMFAIPKLDGGLLFKKINNLTNTSIKIKDGDQNVLGISANYDITKRFYQYIGIKKNTTPKTVIDNSIPFSRGLKYIRGDDNSSNTLEIAKKAKSKMIAESFTLAVSLSTWTLNKELLQPGLLVNVTSPMNMIYTESSFVIKQIDYTYDISNGYIAEIQLTLPEAYTGNDINPLLFGTYKDKNPLGFTKILSAFTKIPDSKDVYDKAKDLGII